MHKLLLAQKCAFANLKKWPVTPRIWIGALIMATFAFWNLSGVVEYSVAVGIRVTPWILPHFFFMPIMVTVYGFLTIVLFSDAPFQDSFSQFLEIRVGKEIWIVGQILYILEASFIHMLYCLFITLIMILPRIVFTTDWGKLIERLCYNFWDTYEYGITIAGIGFSSSILETFTPIQAMLLSALLIWLVSVWMGMLIFMIQIIGKRGMGIAVASFFVFLSYFSNYVGWLMFGQYIFYVTPINWVCLAYLDVTGQNGGPDLWHAISVLVFGIICFGVLGIKAYCAKDME